MTGGTAELSVYNAPNIEDMTIEQMMQWYSMQVNHNIDKKYVEFVQKNRSTMEQQCQRLWDMYNENSNNSTQIISTKGNDVENVNNTNIINLNNPSGKDKVTQPILSTHTALQGQVQQQSQQKDSSASIRVDITGGLYTGKVLFLKPTVRSACLIGRSTSKKFANNGISIPKDLEVSTTHGKIEKTNDGHYSYTDTGSTNGTYLKDSGYQLPAHEPIELPADGTPLELIIGATVLCITIL